MIYWERRNCHRTWRGFLRSPPRPHWTSETEKEHMGRPALLMMTLVSSPSKQEYSLSAVKRCKTEDDFFKASTCSANRIQNSELVSVFSLISLYTRIVETLTKIRKEQFVFFKHNRQDALISKKPAKVLPLQVENKWSPFSAENLFWWTKNEFFGKGCEILAAHRSWPKNTEQNAVLHFIFSCRSLAVVKDAQRENVLLNASMLHWNTFSKRLKQLHLRISQAEKKKRICASLFWQNVGNRKHFSLMWSFSMWSVALM